MSSKKLPHLCYVHLVIPHLYGVIEFLGAGIEHVVGPRIEHVIGQGLNTLIKCLHYILNNNHDYILFIN